MLIAAAVVVFVIPALWVALLIANAFFISGFTLAEMDWNKDGRTSLSEMMHAADVGERQSLDDPRCRELFFYKDGRSAKVICPAGHEQNSN